MFSGSCFSGPVVVGALSLAHTGAFSWRGTDSFWKVLALSKELLASAKNPFTVILGPRLVRGNKVPNDLKG